MVYERESQIAINYSRLEKKLKEVRTVHVQLNVHGTVHATICMYTYIRVYSTYMYEM